MGRVAKGATGVPPAPGIGHALVDVDAGSADRGGPGHSAIQPPRLHVGVEEQGRAVGRAGAAADEGRALERAVPGGRRAGDEPDAAISRAGAVLVAVTQGAAVDAVGLAPGVAEEPGAAVVVVGG